MKPQTAFWIVRRLLVYELTLVWCLFLISPTSIITKASDSWFFFSFVSLLLMKDTQGGKEPLQRVDGYFSYCERKCILLNRGGKLSSSLCDRWVYTTSSITDHLALIIPFCSATPTSTYIFLTKDNECFLGWKKDKNLHLLVSDFFRKTYTIYNLQIFVKGN